MIIVLAETAVVRFRKLKPRLSSVTCMLGLTTYQSTQYTIGYAFHSDQLYHLQIACALTVAAIVTTFIVCINTLMCGRLPVRKPNILTLVSGVLGCVAIVAISIGAQYNQSIVICYNSNTRHWFCDNFDLLASAQSGGTYATFAAVTSFASALSGACDIGLSHGISFRRRSAVRSTESVKRL